MKRCINLEEQKDMLLKVKDKFFKNIIKSSDTACWEWNGGHCMGYGWFYVGGGRHNKFEIYAHRASLFYKTNLLQEVAMHTCDNRKCCNPNHLIWGNKKENSQDALKKQRAFIGSSNSNAVLNEKIVKQIHELRNIGLKFKEIAEILNVKKTTAYSAYKYGWKHVNAKTTSS